jgi:hypothetical protein
MVLNKEYEQYLRNQGTNVREASNYFKDHPEPDLTPDAIVSALASRGGDPRTSAYIKWQLLSGLPDDASAIPPQPARMMLSAYRAAPLPINRPGIALQEQQRLEDGAGAGPQGAGRHRGERGRKAEYGHPRLPR